MEPSDPNRQVLHIYINVYIYICIYMYVYVGITYVGIISVLYRYLQQQAERCSMRTHI